MLLASNLTKPNILSPKLVNVIKTVKTAAKEVKINIALDGADLALNDRCFVLIENNKSNSESILSINQAVLKTSGSLLKKSAKSIRSNMVLANPKNVAIMTISVLL